MSSLNVQLVAADRMVWEGDATAVYIRTVDGEMGILPGHTPVLSVLADSGEVRIDTVEGGRQTAKVQGGFVSVDDQSKVTIVSDSIETASTTA
ncbi:F0F1 ATP synthase subunit epsilon [Calidifontibacter terrae]